MNIQKILYVIGVILVLIVVGLLVYRFFAAVNDGTGHSIVQPGTAITTGDIAIDSEEERIAAENLQQEQEEQAQEEAAKKREDDDEPTEAEQLAYLTYAREVSGPDECVSFETYNAEEGECQFTCASEQECEALVNAVVEEQGGGTEKLVTLTSDGADLDERATAEYTVGEEGYLYLSGGEQTSEEEKVKDWFRTALSRDFAEQYVSRLVLYEDSNSRNGVSVARAEDGKWNMYINMAELDQRKDDIVLALVEALKLPSL